MNSTDLQIQIHANTKEALSNIKKLEQEIKGFSTTTKNTNTSISDFTKTLKNLAGVYVGFEALRGSITKVLDVGMSFEKSISKLGAVTQASTDDLAKMQQQAKDLGASTKYTATQVAEAMNYEAMAGMKTNEILTATNDILNLATAGNLDLAKSSDIATDAMTAFGLESKDMAHLTDVMASTITNSNTNIEQLGEAFKNVAPVSKTLNVSLEETSAMLGTLANAGRKGGEAGTHLKIIFQRLASSNKEVKKGFDELGISAYDSNGKLKPLGGTLKEIEGKLKDLDEQTRNKIMKNLFGEEVISSANILLGSLGDMDELLKKVSNSAGEAGRIAKEMNNNLQGDTDALNSALEGLANNIYTDLLPALRDITQSLTETVRYINENSDEFIKWGKIIVEVVAQVYLLRKAMLALEFMQMATGATTAGGALIGMASKAKTAVAGLMAFATANPVLLGLGVVIAGVTYKLNEMRAEIDKLNESTDNFIATSKNTNAIYTQIGATYDKTAQKYKLTRSEYDKLGEAIGQQITNITNEIEATKKASDGTVQYKEQIAQLERQKRELIKSYSVLSDKLVITKEDTNKLTDATKKQNKEDEKTLKKQKELAKEREKEKKQILKDLDERLKKQVTTLNQMYRNEKSLTIAYKKLEDEKLKTSQKYYNLRNNLETKTANKLTQINKKAMSEYSFYVDSQKRADEALYKAKKALKDGDLSEAKAQQAIYLDLIEQGAGEEITTQREVLKFNKSTHKSYIDIEKDIRLTKRQTAQEYRKDLEEGKELSLGILALQEQEEQKVHKQKLDNKKKEIDKIHDEIKAQEALIAKTKLLMENVKDISFDMQAEKAKKDIEDIEKRIKNFKSDNIKVNLDTKQAITKSEELRTKIQRPTESTHSILLGNIDDTKKQLMSLQRTTTSQHLVYVSYIYPDGHFNSTTYARPYATGGKVAGYDPTDSDDVTARLTRGEFVLNRRATKYYGDDLLYKMNNIKLPKFATGGKVGASTISNTTAGVQRTVNLNLTIGDNTYSLQSDEDVANALERYIRSTN